MMIVIGLSYSTLWVCVIVIDDVKLIRKYVLLVMNCLYWRRDLDTVSCKLFCVIHEV